MCLILDLSNRRIEGHVVADARALLVLVSDCVALAVDDSPPAIQLLPIAAPNTWRKDKKKQDHLPAYSETGPVKSRLLLRERCHSVPVTRY